MLTAAEISALYREHQALKYVESRCEDASDGKDRADLTPRVFACGGANSAENEWVKDVGDTVIELVAKRTTDRIKQIEKMFYASGIPMEAKDIPYED